MANVNRTVKALEKAAKAAGVVIRPGKGSHKVWVDVSGRSFAFASHDKECSVGVAKKAWAFLEGRYEAAY